jgi:ankyrin repeat protein
MSSSVTLLRTMFTAPATTNSAHEGGLQPPVCVLPSPQALEEMLASVHEEVERDMFRALLTPKERSQSELSIHEQVKRARDAGLYPLACSIKNKNLPLLTALLKAGLPVKTEDLAGRTPLHKVALYNFCPAIPLLCRMGANIEARDNLGATPLHLCATMKSFQAAKDLIALGADVHAKSNVGNSTLMAAATAANGDVRLVDLFIFHGADVHATNGRLSPLMMAAINGDVDCAKRLLQAGAAVDQAEDGGWQAIHWAAQWGQSAFTDFLLEQGANMDATTDDGVTPLLAAVGQNNFDHAQHLIGLGANIHGVAKANQRTALHLAAEKENLPLAMALVEAGGDLERKDAFNCTPKDIANQIGATNWSDQMDAFLDASRARKALNMVMNSPVTKTKSSQMDFC